MNTPTKKHQEALNDFIEQNRLQFPPEFQHIVIVFGKANECDQMQLINETRKQHAELNHFDIFTGQKLG